MQESDKPKSLRALNTSGSLYTHLVLYDNTCFIPNPENYEYEFGKRRKEVLMSEVYSYLSKESEFMGNIGLRPFFQHMTPENFNLVYHWNDLDRKTNDDIRILDAFLAHMYQINVFNKYNAFRTISELLAKYESKLNLALIMRHKKKRDYNLGVYYSKIKDNNLRIVCHSFSCLQDNLFYRFNTLMTVDKKNALIEITTYK